VRSGRLRILAVTSATRWPELPEVHTLAEAGVPGYKAALCVSLLAPAMLGLTLPSTNSI